MLYLQHKCFQQEGESSWRFNDRGPGQCVFRDVWDLHNTIMKSVVTHVHVHVHFCRDPIVNASLVVKGKGSAPARRQTYYVQMNVHVEQDQRDNAKIKYVFFTEERECVHCMYL